MTALLVNVDGATSGSGSLHLDRLVHQLWGAQIAAGRLVVALGTEPPPGWEARHRWRVLPSPDNPHLLVQLAPRPATFRALTAYRGLRSPRRRAARVGLALQTTVRPDAGELLVVAHPVGQAAAIDGHEPLSVLRAALGGATGSAGIAVVGVRRGANAKPTLQLFTATGEAAGYAKLAWNPLTADLVRAETRALSGLARSLTTPDRASGEMRVPHLIGSGQVNGNPFVMTEPLPDDVVQLRGPAALSIRSMAGLFPITRQDTPARTAQVTLALDRLHRVAGLERSRDTTEVVGAARRLGERIRSATTLVPVASRWHGDLVPWNAGRDRTGTTWLWDWESSEPDAPVGMDVLHWYLNATGPMPAHATGAQFRETSERARPALQALGAGPLQRALIGAAYALALAERNATLAAAQGGWQHHRLPAAAVLDLLAAAEAILDREMGTSRA